MSVQAIPEGYHSVTPYLSIDGCAQAIDFYKRAFGATERFRLEAPDGQIGHAELQIGDSAVMMADGCDEAGFRSPSKLSGSSVGLHIYVENVDEMFAQAVEAGAREVSAVQDQFYGDRSGTLEDPYGHVWFLATHKEDLSPDEINRRAEALFSEG